MGNSLSDEVKGAIRSTIDDLLRGYAMGDMSFQDVANKAAAEISDEIFNMMIILPTTQDMQLSEYLRIRRESLGFLDTQKRE